MSKTIDSRVVEMTFDNKQFEKGISQSMSSIDSLNKKLGKLDGDEGMNGLANATENVRVKFSALQAVAFGALEEIGRKALNAGTSLVKSLSIDQITAGFAKYSDKTTSMQTIVNATIGEEESLEEATDRVSAALDRLNWFTDETSYNFTDMVGNIGKFTAAGVDLDKSISAMEGIATWAGISGAGIQQASSAMYNFSQAMGSGAMMAQDWKSIENANMATKEFKETAMEAAAAEGLLEKSFDESGNAIYKTFKGTIVTAENFRSTLSEKWFDSKVMTTALNMYGGFADQLSETMDLFDDSSLTTSKVLDWIDDYNAAIDDSEKKQKMLSDAYKSWGFSGTLEEFSAQMELLASDEYDLGRRAFKAAQEAKTFREAIDATKDAVSTGWMNVFEKIFGNYYESKELWTELANRLYDAFMPSVNSMNDILDNWLGMEDAAGSLYYAIDKIKEANDNVSDDQIQKWMEDFAAASGDAAKEQEILKEAMDATGMESDELRNIFTHVATAEDKLGMGGRTDLIQSLWNLWDAFSNIKAVATEAWEEIFGPAKTADESAKTLTEIIKKIQELTAQFRDMFLTEDGLTENGEKLKRIFKGLFAILKIGKTVLNLILAPVKALAKFIGNRTKGLGGSIFEMSANVGDAIVSFSDWLEEIDIVNVVTEKLTKAIEWLAEKIEIAVDRVKEFIAESGAIEWISEKFTTAIEKIQEFFTESEAVSWVTSKWEELKVAVEGAFDGPKFKKAMPTLQEILDDISEKLDAIKEKLKPVTNFFKKVASLIGDKLKKAFESIKDAYNNNGGLKGVFDLILKGALFANILQIITFLSTVTKSIKKAAGGFKDLFDHFGKAIDGFAKNQRAEAMKKMAEAVLIMVGAVAAMALVIHFLGPEVNEALTDVIIMIVALGLMMKVAGDSVKNLGNAAGMAAMAAGIGAFAAALVILTASVLIFALIPTDRLEQGLLSVAILVFTMSLVMKSLSKNMTSTIEGAAAIVSFAQAVRILAKSVKILGKMDEDKMTQGVLAIAALVFTMTMALKLLNGNSFDAKGAVLILAAVVAIKMLVSAVILLGSLKPEKALMGVGAIGILLLELALFLEIVKSSGENMISTAFSLILLATALNMLIVPIMAFGMMDPINLAQGLIAVGVALAEMVAALLLLDSEDIIAKAGALAIVAASIGLLVPAIMLLGMIDFATMLQGIAGVGLVLAELVVSLLILEKIGPGIMTAALAILALGAGLALVGVGMVAFTAGLATLVALGTPAIAILGALGLAIVALIGLLIVEIAKAKIKVLEIIAESMPTIIESITTILSGILEILWNNLPTILGIIGTLCLGLVGILAELVPTILLVVGEICTGVLGLLTELVPTVLGIIGILLAGLITLLTEQLPEFINLLNTLVVELLGFIVDTAANLIDAIQQVLDILAAWIVDDLIPWAVKFIFDAILSFLTALDEAIRSDMGSIVEMFLMVILDTLFALFKGVGEFLTSDRFKEVMASIGTTIKESFQKELERTKELWDTVKEAVTGWVHKVGEWFTEKWNVVKDAVSEFFSGTVKSGIDAAISKIKEVVQGLITRIKNMFKGKDPDVDANMKDSGKYLTEGIAVGLEDDTALGKVKGAVKSLASKIKGWFDKEEDINSPSKEFALRGRFIDEGLAEGVKDYSDVAAEATKDMAEDTLDTMSGLMSALSKSLDDDMDTTPVITPVLDLSEIQNGRKAINGIFGNSTIGLTAADVSRSRAAEEARRMDVADAVNSAIKKYSERLADTIKASTSDTNVNVSLQGDANGLFKLVRDQNNRYKASTGKSALI